LQLLLIIGIIGNNLFQLKYCNQTVFQLIIVINAFLAIIISFNSNNSINVNPFAMPHDGRADTLPVSLHITGPSQCPRADKPHLASIACTCSAVAGSALKEGLRGCAGVELSPCRQRVQLAVSPGYSV
jgi:hypothetical protein